MYRNNFKQECLRGSLSMKSRISPIYKTSFKAALLGGFIVFLWSIVSWKVLPFHQMNIQHFKNESRVSQVLMGNAPKSGVYVFNVQKPESIQSSSSQSSARSAVKQQPAPKWYNKTDRRPNRGDQAVPPKNGCRKPNCQKGHCSKSESRMGITRIDNRPKARQDATQQRNRMNTNYQPKPIYSITAFVKNDGLDFHSPVPYIKSIVISIIAAFCATWLLLQTSIVNFWKSVGFITLLGLFAAITVLINQLNWSAYPLINVILASIDLVIGWFLGGLAIAKWVLNRS